MNWIIKSPFKNIRDLSNYLVKSTNNHDAQEKQEDSSAVSRPFFIPYYSRLWHRLTRESSKQCMLVKNRVVTILKYLYFIL